MDYECSIVDQYEQESETAGSSSNQNAPSDTMEASLLTMVPDNRHIISEEKMIKFSHMWTITNFSYYCHEMGLSLVSVPFSVSGSYTTTWRFRLFPMGMDEGTSDFICFFLVLISSDIKEVRGNFKFSLLNAKREKTLEKASRRIYQFIPGIGWGIYKFIKRNVLFEGAEDLLPEDTITLFCEAKVFFDFFHVSDPISDVQLKVPECTLSEDMSNLFESKKFADVTFRLDGGREFQVHKAILGARSEVFAAMFGRNIKRVDVSDVDHKVFNEMLRFIYTGKAPNLNKLAYDLLPLAHNLKIQELKIMCEKELSENLSAENAADTLIRADLHNAGQLKLETLNYIVQYASYVIETAGWKNMATTHPHLLAESYRTLATVLNSSNELREEKLVLIEEEEGGCYY